VEFDVAELTDLERENLLNSLVVPRPIAWITSLDARGVGNLAPFSYFNLASASPPVVMVAFSSKGRKDTLANIVERREFVVNVVSHVLRHPMVTSSADVAPEVDESDLLGLEVLASAAVAPPRLAGAAAALECRLHEVVPVFDSHVVLGRVEHIHVADEVLRHDRVVAELLAPVARLGGSLYTTVTESYRIDRPKVDDPGRLRQMAYPPPDPAGPATEAERGDREQDDREQDDRDQDDRDRRERTTR
jgi:flavin reductase (DIM6/NTAB) family NADH-FMN oxidoreductase RutF